MSEVSHGINLSILSLSWTINLVCRGLRFFNVWCGFRFYRLRQCGELSLRLYVLCKLILVCLKSDFMECLQIQVYHRLRFCLLSWTQFHWLHRLSFLSWTQIFIGIATACHILIYWRPKFLSVNVMDSDFSLLWTRI